jgi:excisionase family DNA binding protein
MGAMTACNDSTGIRGATPTGPRFRSEIMLMFESFHKQIAAASLDELPRLLGELEALKALLLVRLLSPLPPPVLSNGQGDRWLTVEELAHKLGQSKDWIYRHAHQLPFTTRMGRSLRFSERGAEGWMAARVP